MRLTVRGMGRSYGDASLGLPDGLVLLTSKQSGIVEFDKPRGGN